MFGAKMTRTEVQANKRDERLCIWVIEYELRTDKTKVESAASDLRLGPQSRLSDLL